MSRPCLSSRYAGQSLGVLSAARTIERGLRTPVGLSALALALACVPAPIQRPSPAEFANGTFAYTIRNGSTVIVGMLIARDGDVTVRPRAGSCYTDRTERRTDEETVAYFKCEGTPEFQALSLAIDRRDPQARSRWHATVTSMVKVQECTAYTVDRDGRRICTSWRTGQAEQTGSLGGTILLKLVAPGG